MGSVDIPVPGLTFYVPIVGEIGVDLNATVGVLGSTVVIDIGLTACASSSKDEIGRQNAGTLRGSHPNSCQAADHPNAAAWSNHLQSLGWYSNAQRSTSAIKILASSEVAGPEECITPINIL